MQELKLIEIGLIKVYETEKSEKVVDGRELHEGLESKRQFADWIKQRLSEVDAVENEDYICISQNCEKPIGGRPTIEYILKLNIAKEMAMLERNEKGKQYRRYLIEVEEKYKSNPYKNLSPEVRAIFKLDMQQTELSNRIEKLENTMTIDYSQQETLKQLVNVVAITALGGKKSNAYGLIGKKVFADVYRHLKNTFQVNSYRNIATVDFDKAIRAVNDWKPCGDIELMIAGANSRAV